MESRQFSWYGDGLWTRQLGFNSQHGQEIFIFSTASKLALGPTQWVPGALTPWVKWLDHKADHSPASGAVVKNGGAITPLPHTSSWSGA
jgi:hypothetical protein